MLCYKQWLHQPVHDFLYPWIMHTKHIIKYTLAILVFFFFSLISPKFNQNPVIYLAISDLFTAVLFTFMVLVMPFYIYIFFPRNFSWSCTSSCRSCSHWATAFCFFMVHLGFLVDLKEFVASHDLPACMSSRNLLPPVWRYLVWIYNKRFGWKFGLVAFFLIGYRWWKGSFLVLTMSEEGVCLCSCERMCTLYRPIVSHFVVLCFEMCSLQIYETQ